MAGLGYKDFTAGAVLTAAQVDGYLMEQSVMNFAGTAARGSALSSVQSAGMMAHVGGGTVTVYDGSAWQQVYPAQAGLVFVAGTAFSAVSSVSVNNCFTSTYDNYLVTVRVLGSTDENLNLRLRVGGTDASGTNYRQQDLNITGASVAANLSLAAQYRAAAFGTANPTSGQIQFHRPNIAERTSMISHIVTGNSTTALYLPGCNHELATAYDGFSLLPQGGATVTGTVRVYGYRNS
jgi:hypothetical protein